jgi:hypothetical protein
MPAVLLKNTLLSRPFMQRIALLARQEAALSALIDIVTHFEKMRAFASEIHTEIHLVKPILKVLGYTFESKPQFFEEGIKGPDFALFKSEEERLKSSPLWGTKPYYEQVLAVLLVKRYGRNLEEGISGFYLDFENRIPLYQSMYLAKKAGVPWSILTNGKSWLLLKRPFAFEKPLIEIDLEQAVARDDGDALHLFYQIFSFTGLDTTLTAFLEEERNELIAFLKEKRRSLANLFEEGDKTDAYGMAVPLYTHFFPGSSLSRTARNGEQGLSGRAFMPSGKPGPAREYDQADLFTYLLARGTEPEASPEESILSSISRDRTKDNLLSLKILDMTPGFGNVSTHLVETIVYLSFLLPYREKRGYVAEWENEGLLHKFVLSRILYGVEKCPFPLDVLQNSMLSRFNAPGVHYRLGNPLLGMSLAELFGSSGDKGRAGLFSNSDDLMARLKEMHRRHATLSDRIKEDALVKSEIEATLTVSRQRIGEVMDLVTASYFENAFEKEKIDDLLDHIDGDEEVWQAARAARWYVSAREMAAKKHFFHMEIEFPFLLNDGFDMVFIQPALNYLWDEQMPVDEMAKAYIKRAMAYLKETGMIVLMGAGLDELVPELRKSKRYAVEARGRAVMVRRC